jgi:hypothetical protein
LKEQLQQHTKVVIDAKLLDWDEWYLKNHNSCDTDNNTTTTYDIVFGSDIVASIYDPIKLAHTISSLCHAQSIVYISYKERLSSIHELFHNTMNELFHHVMIFQTSTGRVISNDCTNVQSEEDSRSKWYHHQRPSQQKQQQQHSDFISRNKNPNVYIIVAANRKLRR